MNRFFITEPTSTLDIFNYLTSNNYEEIESTIINDDDNEPIKIVIDRESKVVWHTDNQALESLKNNIKEHQNEIETVTYKEVLQWK